MKNFSHFVFKGQVTWKRRPINNTPRKVAIIGVFVHLISNDFSCYLDDDPDLCVICHATCLLSVLVSVHAICFYAYRGDACQTRGGAYHVPENRVYLSSDFYDDPESRCIS